MSNQASRADQPSKAEVVVGVDGSPDSLEALAWAAREAKLRGAELVVVHANFIRRVAEPDHPRLFEKDRQILECAVEQAKKLEPDLAITGRLPEPPAAKALIDASKTAELLVVGSRGMGGIKEFVIGSVSNLCVRQAHCPVVVVRPPVATTATPARDEG